MWAVMLLLLGGHVVAVAATVIAGRSSMRLALLTAAIMPAVTAVWAGTSLTAGAEVQVDSVTWVEGLDIGLRFQSDALALMMTLLVSGIGALVFVYASGYFKPDAAKAQVFGPSLLAFSASMLGLVLADSVWTLFIFWELTSVTSFILVGHKNIDPAVRAAARRALMITGGGGLALLAGLLILAQEAGTSTISDFGVVSGGQAGVAAVLVVVAAATKSAQFPFHVWLPGAMAAPTPVSAYLHSATMVKAGVLLVAVTGSVFADVQAFKGVGIAFGLASVIWGAVGALRHRDAKLILAWGTVSQLGLMIMLLSLGTGKAVFAAVSILFAHALFKAALFLVVGEIDIRTGTRNIDELGGLSKSMPVSFFVALAAGLSMAGAPPLLGFAAKEAAVEAALLLSGLELLVVGFGVIGGSVLTVAYTARFLLTVFGSGPETIVAPRRLAMSVPAVILATAGLLGFAFVGTVNNIVRPAAIELSADAEPYLLKAWPGFTTAFIVSGAILVVGAFVGHRLSAAQGAIPRPLGADRADGLLDATLDIARMTTARVQHGSLPVYIVTMATTVALAATPFVADIDTSHLVWWDQPIQLALAIAIVAAATAGAFVGSRLGAALTLGAVGIGVTGLFVVQGAPDLALTQLLVETIVVVGFVLGLGHLSHRFPQASGVWRNIRLVVSLLCGGLVMVGLAAAGSNPVGSTPVAELIEESVVEGGGNNVVNVILTDLRALDTLGEVVVLATVALGIIALGKTSTSAAASRSKAKADSGVAQ